MFTGLIEAIGEIEACRPAGAGARLCIRWTPPEEPIREGESIAVDGCCLTAVEPSPAGFEADLSAETLERTGGLRRWVAGRRVHLERALRAGARLGGHIVQGHVDGRLRIAAWRAGDDGGAVAGVELPPQWEPLVVEKGSIALDGVSLTIARLVPGRFDVALIPETLARTTLAERRVGDELLVEFDVLAKYVVRALRAGAGPDRR